MVYTFIPNVYKSNTEFIFSRGITIFPRKKAVKVLENQLGNSY